jgi:hypothetical protein
MTMKTAIPTIATGAIQIILLLMFCFLTSS